MSADRDTVRAAIQKAFRERGYLDPYPSDIDAITDAVLVVLSGDSAPAAGKKIEIPQAEPRRWWVIHEDDLATMLRRVEAGESPDLLVMEWVANSDTEVTMTAEPYEDDNE